MRVFIDTRYSLAGTFNNLYLVLLNQHSLEKYIAKIKRLTDKYEKNCINYLKPKIDNFDIYAAIGMPEHMMTVVVLPVLSTYLSFNSKY